jgi:hypothetical protein
MRRHGAWVLATACVAVPLAAQSGDVAGLLKLDFAIDTSIPGTGRWPLRVDLPGPARVTVTFAPLLPDTPPLNVENQRVTGSHTFWPLRGPGDAPLLAGAYRLIVTAEPDGAGGGAPPLRAVRVVVVERVTPDTQVHPPSLDKMKFLPESTSTVSRRPGFLIVTGIGVATLAATWVLADDPTASPVTIVVPGVLAAGGLIGFLKGRPSRHAVPANVAHNNRLVDDDAAARRRIADANARLLAAAALRIRVVDQP